MVVLALKSTTKKDYRKHRRYVGHKPLQRRISHQHLHIIYKVLSILYLFHSKLGLYYKKVALEGGTRRTGVHCSSNQGAAAARCECLGPVTLESRPPAPFLGNHSLLLSNTVGTESKF